jgi:hypothetical protein
MRSTCDKLVMFSLHLPAGCVAHFNAWLARTMLMMQAWARTLRYKWAPVGTLERSPDAKYFPGDPTQDGVLPVVGTVMRTVSTLENTMLCMGLEGFPAQL